MNIEYIDEDRVDPIVIDEKYYEVKDGDIKKPVRFTEINYTDLMKKLLPPKKRVPKPIPISPEYFKN
jgi:hypothetical protein